ncbi:hypothetical protein PS627_03145 [Pseudomonas fluorescens]|uniref:DUF4174 domain-containing protein n=1 Tax=Pseudomonas fluorescens TaxID=294 RepID=UPI00125113E1|nr:DUF4174 domain-containing protein [Pseudomonas fluorescens]CAG8868762.1 hypothetical protein PS627_03145 [Pseudomonas fluorescens]VVP68406.1 hypothetical protein PS910_00364 [Pseudomonas fluorescens]
MFVRSLTLAALFAAAAPVLAADSDAPLAQDLGKARPLVVIAPSSADPTLRSLNEALKDATTQAAFKERSLVLYSVAGMVGKREDKNLEQQTTMALIRELKLGASKGTKVILIGKDGERHMLKDDDGATRIEAKTILDAVDALPATEKAVTAPEPVASTAAAKPAKDTKPAKPVKPSGPPKPLED